MVWDAPRGIDDIVARLRDNDASLQSLYLMRQRRFEEADAKALCEALSQNTVLHDLNISSHAISPEIATAFADVLRSSTTLQSLDLGNASFGDEGLAALCPGIAVSTSLLHLNLDGKGLTAAGCSPLAAALSQNTTLKELNVSRNAIGSGGLSTLLPAITSLRHLSFTSCSLSDAASGAAISSLLQSSTNLAILQLEENALDATAAAAIAPGLRASSSLVELHLRGCPLGATGVDTLLRSLPPSLLHLDISGSGGTGSNGLCTAATALTTADSLSLQKLSACGCGGDDAALAALIDAMGNASASTHLDVDVSGNEAGAVTVAAVARGASLTAVCLHDCKLGEEGITALCAAIESASSSSTSCSFVSLCELDLSGNGMSSEHLVQLLTALKNSTATCPALRQLVIAANPGAMEDAVAEATEALQLVRPEVDVVRRSADTGERDK